ncbi:glycosyltransferase family 61 protein [Providencia rettgeri]|uniref:glycosyltransferase family 61 protein n=1 Tax=Providencia rettgeri TaxID=587 RepID=UPI0005B4039C|nr:glycosyltransferase 61 family protein [Providencia rettgeri]
MKKYKNLTPDLMVEEINIDGYSYYIYKNVNVSEDYFIYNDTSYSIHSTNEYFNNVEWLKKRIKSQRDLGFKYGKATINKNKSVDFLPLVEKPDYLDETVFVYDYPWGHNYQHWLITAVSRLFLFKKIQKKYPQLKILLYSDSPKYKRDILRILEIDESNILELSCSANFKSVIVPEFTSVCGTYIPTRALLEYQIIAHQYSNIPKVFPDRIYISRQDRNGKRPLLNRSELKHILLKYDFKEIILENYSLEEKIKIFSQAKVVCGDFSAGWGHITFCGKNTKLFLIEHDIYKFSNFYKQISQNNDCNFIAINSSSYLKKIILSIKKLIWKISKSGDSKQNKMIWKADIKKIERTLNEHLRN